MQPPQDPASARAGPALAFLPDDAASGTAQATDLSFKDYRVRCERMFRQKHVLRRRRPGRPCPVRLFFQATFCSTPAPHHALVATFERTCLHHHSRFFRALWSSTVGAAALELVLCALMVFHSFTTSHQRTPRELPADLPSQPIRVLYRGRRSTVMGMVHVPSGQTVATKVYSKEKLSAGDLLKVCGAGH